MSTMPPLVPLWLDVKSFAGQIGLLITERNDHEPKRVRSKRLKTIHNDGGRIRKRLRSGAATDVVYVDGSDAKRWSADLAATVGELERRVCVLAEPRLDDSPVDDILDLHRKIEQAANYLQDLSRIDDRDGQLAKGDKALSAHCTVTLIQMAAMVSRKKRTLERLYTAGDLPSPDIPGKRGAANEWFWDTVRPILAKTYNRELPEQFPGDRFIRA